ncbi:hypothetical protein K0M31_009937, partial [Melipona bicolor]
MTLKVHSDFQTEKNPVGFHVTLQQINSATSSIRQRRGQRSLRRRVNFPPLPLGRFPGQSCSVRATDYEITEGSKQNTVLWFPWG